MDRFKWMELEDIPDYGIIVDSKEELIVEDHDYDSDNSLKLSFNIIPYSYTKSLYLVDLKYPLLKE